MFDVAIHQPHYFPWMGYLDKMAKSRKFIVLDNAQLEKGSNMYRNKVSTIDGKEKYITICFEKEHCLDIPFRSIRVDNSIDWQNRQVEFLRTNYKKTPFFGEIWRDIEPFFEKDYEFVIDVLMDSMYYLIRTFNINTDIILQSSLNYDASKRKDDMLIDLCHQIGAKSYLSGNGARKYMNLSDFSKEDISVEYQCFEYPMYTQGHEFVSNLSSLDILFWEGKAKANEIFWENVNRSSQA